MNSPTRIEIIRWLYDTLKPKRFLHTLGVEETAVRLARAYGISEAEASTAALLHDCAKNLSEEELLQICEKEHVDLDPNSAYPQLLQSYFLLIIRSRAANHSRVWKRHGSFCRKIWIRAHFIF